MKRFISYLILAITIPFLLSIAVYAQEGRGMGRIFGTVVDENGKQLEGVDILIEAKDFNFKTTAKSDKKGNWAVAGLGTGVFIITASKEGFNNTIMEVMVSQFKNPPIKIVMKAIKETAEPTGLDEKSRALFTEANSLYEQGNYAGALALFQEFLEKNPSLYPVRLNIGNCYREMKEYDKAISEYNAVLEKIRAEKADLKGDENAAKALANIGEIYMIQENYEKAQEYLKNAIDIYPTDHALAYNVAEIFFQAGQIEKAIEYYTLATKIKPDWSLPYLKIGFAYINKSNFEEAIKNFEKFLELSPQDPQAENIKNIIEQLKKQKK
jgi:tetratricopeptide (TPR) repeat protein